jgi:hypothetical protein
MNEVGNDMTRTKRNLMVGAMMTTLAGGGRTAGAAGFDTSAMPRVRSHNPIIAATHVVPEDFLGGNLLTPFFAQHHSLP